jgi:small-conductance mechanosensitive channel
MNPAATLWSLLLADFNDPRLLWQLIAIVICGSLGWLGSRLLMKRFGGQSGSLGVGLDSFQRVLTPLLTLACIAIASSLLAHWQSVGLLRIAMPLTLSYLLIRATFYLLRKAFGKEGRAGILLQAFEQTIAIVIWSGVALYITGLWPDFINYLDETTLPVGRHRESLLVLLQALLWVGVTLVLALWAAAMLEQRLMKLDTMHTSLRAVLARVGRGLLILVAMLISLSLVGIDPTVLSVFGGALGVGLGLGLQKLVSSYVSGFVVLLERSLTIGDVVNVDKYSGQIVQINTRYTVLRGGDGSESIIPNEMLVSSPVQNLCLSDRHTRVTTSFRVHHDTDVVRLLEAIPPALAKLTRVIERPAPSALLLNIGPEWLEIEASVWIDDPAKGKSGVLSAMNLALMALLKEQQVALPSSLPQ